MAPDEALPCGLSLVNVLDSGLHVVVDAATRYSALRAPAKHAGRRVHIYVSPHGRCTLRRVSYPWPTQKMSVMTQQVRKIESLTVKSVVTRAKLVAIAERLFAERGIEGVSLSDINKAAGQRNRNAGHP